MQAVRFNSHCFRFYHDDDMAMAYGPQPQTFVFMRQVKVAAGMLATCTSSVALLMNLNNLGVYASACRITSYPPKNARMWLKLCRRVMHHVGLLSFIWCTLWQVLVVVLDACFLPRLNSSKWHDVAPFNVVLPSSYRSGYRHFWIVKWCDARKKEIERKERCIYIHIPKNNATLEQYP